MKKTFNRLWVRLSLSIIVIVFLTAVVPNVLEFFQDKQVYVDQTRVYIEAINEEAEWALSPKQIDYIAERWVYEYLEDYYEDVIAILQRTLVIGVLAGLLFGRSLSRPIEKLVAATKAVGARDLTHRVQVRGAQEIQDLAANFNQMISELSHAEQMRRNMIADVSHELLTPLTVLQGNLRAILDDVYELNQDEIAKLYEQNKHLIRLVHDMRQLAQAEAEQLDFEPTTINLSTLATETMQHFLPTAEEKNLTLSTEQTSHLPLVRGDADRLRQVLHNLMANAIRHTPEHGRIAIRTDQTAESVMLSVIDTGEGIAPDLLPHIFDRFYRIQEGRRRDMDMGGTGLGLAISKAIIETHHGRISATSAGKGQGTRFEITLPIYRS